MSPYRPPSRLPASYVPPPGYASAYGPPPSTFNLADFFRLLDARRGLILRVALATILCAVALAMVQPTTYSSSAVVILDPRKNNVTETTSVLSPLAPDAATMQNQLQILTSRELAATVVDRLKLQDDPEFNPTLARPSLMQLVGQMFSLLHPKNWFASDMPAPGMLGKDRIVDNFLSHISADAQGLSTAMNVTARSRDATKAALLANTLADAYVKAQLAIKVNATGATTDWLNGRLQDLSQQLQAQQEAVQRYKAQNNLNDSAPGNSLVDQQMAAINAQVVGARSELAAKQAIKDRIDQLVASGNPADIGQIVASQLIVQLRTQQSELLRQEADLGSKYGPLHPRMQAIQQQKRDMDFKITQEVNRLAASAASDVIMARAHLSSLQGSLGGAEGTARVQNMARIQLQALESNATSTRLQYEAFVQKLRQTQNMDEAQTPESRIISQAPVPLSPAGPKRSMIVAASIPLGVLLGILVALLVEKLGPLLPVRVNGAPRASLVPPLMRTRPRRRPAATAPVAVWNGPPILSEINDPAQLRAADFVLDYPASKYSHAMADLVRQLESRPASGVAGAAIVAVTAPDNGENRAAIAVSLARRGRSLAVHIPIRKRRRRRGRTGGLRGSPRRRATGRGACRRRKDLREAVFEVCSRCRGSLALTLPRGSSFDAEVLLQACPRARG
jgi:succinoglycan biosynthesis transport protein ExoP